MPSFTDRATRSLKHTKSDKPKMGVGIPDYNDGYEGETRIQMVEGNPRLYLKTGAGWFFTGLVQDGAIPDVPTATSTRLGVIKIGDGGTVASDGTYTATAATPAADDITGGDGAVNITTSSGNITIDAAANNSDVIFKGTDNTSDITMLTLDGSEAGNAIFNANVTVGALLIMPDVTNHKILVSDGTSYQEVAMSGDATIANTGAITLAAAQTNVNSILATDLILGEDSQTAIDFGTANEIDFKVDNSVRLTLTASALYPVTDNQIDLGTSSLEFKDAFFDGTVTADAFSGPITVSNLSIASQEIDVSSGHLTLDVASNIYLNADGGTIAFYDDDTLLGEITSSGYSGTAANATHVNVADNESTNENDLIPFIENTSATGNVGLESDGDFHYNPSTGRVTATQLAGTVVTATQGTIDHDSLANFVANEHLDWTTDQGSTNIHSGNYTNTDTVDMGDGFKLVDADSNNDVTEGHYVKFTTQSGSGGVGVVTGSGSSGDPHLVTLNYADTNTVDMGDGFVIEDGDGTEVTITENKEIKFIECTGLDINWTDTSPGSDADPYDLSFTLAASLQTLSGLNVGDGNFIVGNGSAFTVESGSTARSSLGLGTAATQNTDAFLASDTSSSDTWTVSGALIGGNNSKITTSNADTTFSIETTSGTSIFPILDFVSSHSSVGGKIRQDGSDVITFDNDQDVTFADDVTVSGNHYCSGTIRGSADVVAYYSSDPSLKENKELIQSPLNKISQLGGYSFNWKDEAKDIVGDHLNGKDYGVMADEVQALFPELVDTRSNGIRAVKYDKLVPLLIEGIKELKEELNMIKEKS